MSRPRIGGRPPFRERWRRQAQTQAVAWIAAQRRRWLTGGAVFGLFIGFGLALLLRVLGR